MHNEEGLDVPDVELIQPAEGEFQPEDQDADEVDDEADDVELD
jgi:hypothetical protein